MHEIISRSKDEVQIRTQVEPTIRSIDYLSLPYYFFLLCVSMDYGDLKS